MAEILITPADAAEKLEKLTAGDTARFAPGRYLTPLRLSRIRGTKTQPVRLIGDGDAIITQGVSAEMFRREGNRRSKQVQDRDEYPGLWPWIDQGQLVLENCDYVQIENLRFEESWPTHIFISDCRHTRVSNCQFLDGTFAIGARGRRTKHLCIDACRWVQDRDPGRMWREIPWYRIHGTPGNEDGYPSVDIERDWRLFDGDFFRSNDIAGNVTIRHCEIRQCFNAIHAYNKRAKPTLNRNFNIHDCLFAEVRDNVLEPEGGATNWWFHRNRLFNVHKWFSIEHTSKAKLAASYLYFFSNLAWFDSIQGPDPADIPHGPNDGSRGGGVFKLAKKVQQPFGPSYVFHNSFVTRGDYLRKGILPGLEHFHNAILCVDQAGPLFNAYPAFFGDLLVCGPDHHKRRFTMDWNHYEIDLRNDVIRYSGWPQDLIAAGYFVREGIPRCGKLGCDPRFVAPLAADTSGGGLQTKSSSPCRGAGLDEKVKLADCGEFKIAPGVDIGAWQGNKLFEGPAYQSMPEAAA